MKILKKLSRKSGKNKDTENAMQKKSGSSRMLGRRGSPAAKKQDIINLIEKREWNKLREYINTEKGERDLNKLSNYRDFVEQNILHVLCTYRPPTDVVESFLETLGPDLLGFPDGMKRFPLHAAASFCAGSAVIDLLLEHFKLAAKQRDDRDMTPLACMAENSGPKSPAASAMGDSYRPPSLAAFRCLIHANPVALLLTDRSGKNPIALAREAGGSPEIVDGLTNDAVRITQKLVKRGVLNENLMAYRSNISLTVNSSVMLPSLVEIPTGEEDGEGEGDRGDGNNDGNGSNDEKDDDSALETSSCGVLEDGATAAHTPAAIPRVSELSLPPGLRTSLMVEAGGNSGSDEGGGNSKDESGYISA